MQSLTGICVWESIGDGTRQQRERYRGRRHKGIQNKERDRIIKTPTGEMREDSVTRAVGTYLVTESVEQIGHWQERPISSAEDEFYREGMSCPGRAPDMGMREQLTNRLPRVPVPAREHGIPFILDERTSKI